LYNKKYDQKIHAIFLVTIWKERNCRKDWKEQKLITKVMENLFERNKIWKQNFRRKKLSIPKKLKKLERFFGRNNCRTKK